MTRAAKLARLVAVVAALVQLGALAWVFARRVAYPYDLEWMEGGSLCHALRLLRGQPIYAPPSLDFVPFLYTPLYPALLAALAKLLGLRYALGRAISVGSYLLASVLGYRFAAREGGSRATALAAMALPAAAFALTGAWYDLARADSLWLLLSTAALLLLYRAARDPLGLRRGGRRAHALAAASGALLVAAFFTKQTAAPLMLFAAVALAVLDARLLPSLLGSLALLGLPSLWLANRVTHGWFWRYVFELHQQHAFLAQRAFLDTPRVLAAIVGPALLLVPWALARRSSTGLAYAAALALAGALVACTGFGTQWAFANAYIPGVFFPAIAIGVAAGRLASPVGEGARVATVERLALRGQRAPRLRPALVHALLAASLLLKLPTAHEPAALATAYATDLRFADLLASRADPRRFVPARADRDEGDRLIARLREAPGDVLIPFHPFYGALAGKSTFVHQMGVMDVVRAGLGTPRGLAEAIRARRFALVVVDDKIFDKWSYWPGLQSEYEPAGPVPGPRVFSGARTVPAMALVPRTHAPDPAAGNLVDGAPIDHEIQ